MKGTATGHAAIPRHSRHLAFGDVAAVWATLRGLGLPELVDEAIGARRAAVSVGTYLALAVLHHATASAPKQDFADWWGTTSAVRFVRPRVAPAALGRQRFARALDQLTDDHLERIGAAVLSAVTGQLDLGAGVLAVDVPNFATCSGSVGADGGSPDIALVGLGLVVSRDGAVPLLANAYRRGCQGSAGFGELIDQLSARYRALAGDGDMTGGMTTVFDAGQHSQVNLADRSGRHFVGSLPVDDHPDLLARPATGMRHLDPRRFAAVSVLDTTASVQGTRRRVVLIRSATLRAVQSRAFTQALFDATRRLDGLAAALAAGTFRQPRDRVLAEIARITRFRFHDRVLSTALTGARPGELRLEWRVDDAAVRRIDDEIFGKQLLVTDHDDWPVADVITAYRARYHLESTFRMFPDCYPGTTSETWRWTERRIGVHAMIRVLAATATHLMRHRAQHAGIDLSVRELLDQLAGIQETQLTYGSTGGRPRVRRLLTDRDPTQARLFDLFELGDLAPG